MSLLFFSCIGNPPDLQKRHQCCIDLSTNTLRISSTEIPFLSEHELPDKARRRGEQEIAEEMGINPVDIGSTAAVADRSGTGSLFPGAGNSLTTSAAASGASNVEPGLHAGSTGASAFKESDIQTVNTVPLARDTQCANEVVLELGYRSRDRPGTCNTTSRGGRGKCRRSCVDAIRLISHYDDQRVMLSEERC
jgi:hypothetical protein